MTYSSFIEELQSYAEPSFQQFQKRLIFTDYEILGVKTPVLRKLASKYAKELEKIFAFPNEYYETVFIKLTIVSKLPFQEFLRYLEACVALIDNWALCDSFKGREIPKRKKEFLPVLESLFSTGKEYYQRYALVVFLSEYVEKEYLSLIKEYLRRADTQPYYVHMAAAWLTAEILIKEYEYGVSLLKEGVLDVKTHNKAIQKAIESYRLTLEQKEFLRSLKIK